jgi:hypothetical protein
MSFNIFWCCLGLWEAELLIRLLSLCVEHVPTPKWLKIVKRHIKE